MSEYVHHTMIVTDVESEAEDKEKNSLASAMAAFKLQLPRMLRPLLVGPIRLHNGYVQYVFAASGGRVGGTLEGQHQYYRRALYDICQDNHFEVVTVEHGEGATGVSRMRP